MNKKDFIETIRRSTELPREIDLEAVCSYLETKLSDEVDTDPAVFLRCMQLSFDIFNHLSETEEQKHLEALATSIGDAIDSEAESDDENVPPSVTQTNTTVAPKCEKQQGLWQKICNKKGTERALGITAFSVVSVLLLPFIAVAMALCLVLYTVPIVIATSIMLAVLVPTISLAVIAIIALSYGIATLFTSLPAGIMEIGLGTVLFSITILLWAINLKFFTFIVPFVVSKITLLIKTTFSHPVSLVFGKEAK